MRKIVLFGLLVGCLGACKSDSTSPLLSNQQQISKQFLSQIAPGFYALSDSIIVYGAMWTDVLTTENVLGGSTPNYSYKTITIFYDSSGHVVVPASVKLNGISIPSFGAGGGNHTASTQTFGAMQYWKETPTDSTILFPLKDSIMAPNRFRITSPHPIIDTIPKNAGFTLTYQDPGTDSVYISIWYDSSTNAILFDSSKHFPQGAMIQAAAANTGSFSVTSSMLASFPNSGLLQIWVSSGKRKFVPVLGRNYLMTSSARARTYCFIRAGI